MAHCTDNFRHHGWTCSDSLSGSSNELFYSAGRTNFIYQLSVEVSPVTMPPKEQSNYFSWLRQRKVVSILKIKLQWMKGKFYNIKFLVSANPLKAQWLHLHKHIYKIIECADDISKFRFWNCGSLLVMP